VDDKFVHTSAYNKHISPGFVSFLFECILSGYAALVDTLAILVGDLQHQPIVRLMMLLVLLKSNI